MANIIGLKKFQNEVYEESAVYLLVLKVSRDSLVKFP